MSIYENIKSLRGLAVQIIKPGDTLKANMAYKVTCDYDDGEDHMTKSLESIISDPNAASLTALIIGNWSPESGESPEAISKLLIDNKDKLPTLKSIYFGDVIGEECEISWLEQCDQSPLLHAFPNLEEAYFRGGNGLRFPSLNHSSLKKLVIQTGGLPTICATEILGANLPNLDHLEMWLGTDEYGFDGDVSMFADLFAGSIFPNLSYLGLRNSIISDHIAVAIVDAPILERLSILDLSMGTIGDEGAKALLASPLIRNLQTLNLDHYFISDDILGELMKLDIQVIATEEGDEDEDDGEILRYVEVSE